MDEYLLEYYSASFSSWRGNNSGVKWAECSRIIPRDGLLSPSL